MSSRTPPAFGNTYHDDFGIKYEGKEQANHLLAALTDHYKIENDWEGKLYCGIELGWNYEGRWVDTSMRTYVSNQLVRYDYPQPKGLQQTPYRYIARRCKMYQDPAKLPSSTPKASYMPSK